MTTSAKGMRHVCPAGNSASQVATQLTPLSTAVRTANPHYCMFFAK